MQGRPLKYLVIHCSATPEGRDVRPEQIIRWHEQRWGKGAIGYRSFIDIHGVSHRLRAANMNAIVEPEEITFGVAGINSESHHICYAGGMNRSGDTPKDTRTDAQKKALESIIRFYLENINPAIYIAGHYAFSNKACPSFNVPEWLRSIGIPEENIWNRDPFNMHFWHKRWNK